MVPNLSKPSLGFTKSRLHKILVFIDISKGLEYRFQASFALVQLTLIARLTPGLSVLSHFEGVPNHGHKI